MTLRASRYRAFLRARAFRPYQEVGNGQCLGRLVLHAMGRWFQRSFVNKRAALLTDLRALAMAANDERLSRPGEFEIRASDGRWAGVIMEIENQTRILATRSFLTH